MSKSTDTHGNAPFNEHGALGDHLSNAGESPVESYPTKPTATATGEPVLVVGAADDNSSGHDGAAEWLDPHWLESKCSCVVRAFNYVVPKGGILSGVLNLASQTFGAGIMSVPSAFASTGVVMCVIYLVTFTLLTVYSLHLLAKVSARTNLWTFESLGRNLLGRGGDVFAALVIWVLCFGGAVGFVVAVGDILGTLLKHENVPPYLKTVGGRRCLQAAVWLFFMLPVALPKRVNSLRYISLAGVTFVVLVVFSVVGHSAANAFDGGIRKDLVMVQTGNSGVSGISIFVFSLLCQGNSLRIAHEAIPRDVTRMTITAAIACTICCVLYFLVGFFGYAEFGSAIKGNILVLYDPYKEPLFLICFIGMIVKLVASFAQNMLACRTALFQVMHWELNAMPYWKHTIFATLFATGALVLGLFVPNINIVFGLCGATCGSFMGYILPALYIMYAGNWSFKSVGVWHYAATYMLLITGVIAVVFGTASTIYSTVVEYG